LELKKKHRTSGINGTNGKFLARLVCFAAPAIVLLAVLPATLPSVSEGAASAQGGRARAGGRLVASKSAAPQTFNRLFATDEPTTSMTEPLVGHLVKINRQTQLPEPELAESWRVSPDGRRITFTLRRGVQFSDGQPFTADDVVFTFAVINDPNVAAPSADVFNIQGQRIQVEKVDASTVAFTLPVPYAGGVRLFDGPPILPRHILEPAWRAGRLRQEWGLGVAPERVVGLGPFKIKSYVPGQRLVLGRNERYWKRSATGSRLPYLDELVFVIDRDRNTQLLKFQRGETDVLSPVNADDLAVLRPVERQGRIRIFDLGPSMIREVFWFNQHPGQRGGRPIVDPVKLAWFRETKFRQAVSSAIDRAAIVNLVFAGRAAEQYGFLSAGDRVWHNPNVPKFAYDQARARQLLEQAGFRYQGAQLLDPQGREVAFTLTTNAGNALRTKMSTLIQADLAKVGMKVTLQAVEAQALLSRLGEGGDYEACLLAIVSGDADPTSHQNALLSRGSGHWWHPAQQQPATPWEARIDQLMQRQMGTLNTAARKRLFNEVQSILGEQQPFIFLAARNLIVGATSDLGNLRPALLPDFLLWNCDEIYRR
jgi:peptide/nickel transport system substrate-binding protein